MYLNTITVIEVFMKVELGIDKILRKLLIGHQLEMLVGDSTIAMQTVDGGTKLILSSLVYVGGNFIPFSVRRCVQNVGRKDRYALRTFLSMDEQNYQVSLKYIGLTKDLNSEEFRGLIDEFSQQADEWRLYLDEHDRNDLIYIPVK